jgi:hypothetical protein
MTRRMMFHLFVLVLMCIFFSECTINCNNKRKCFYDPTSRTWSSCTWCIAVDDAIEEQSPNEAYCDCYGGL